LAEPGPVLLSERHTSALLWSLLHLSGVRAVGPRGCDLGGHGHRRALAGRVAIIPELESDAEPELNHDSSTNTLIRRYRTLKH
jgi:glucose-6-phosphate isomerase